MKQCQPNRNVRLQPMFQLGKWCHTHERPISACDRIAELDRLLTRAAPWVGEEWLGADDDKDPNGVPVLRKEISAALARTEA